MPLVELTGIEKVYPTAVRQWRRCAASIWRSRRVVRGADGPQRLGQEHAAEYPRRDEPAVERPRDGGRHRRVRARP